MATLRRKVESLRHGQIKAKELESLARSLGRKKENRGKEPTWESCFHDLPPLSIPHHGGKDISRGTKNSILNQLEDDTVRWEQQLDEMEQIDDKARH